MKAYEIIVNQILDKLEDGILPWQKSWLCGTPENYETGVKYRGLNKLILLCDDFIDKRYLTSKQIFKLGGKIKEDSKSTCIIYWNFKDKKDNDRTFPIIKYYRVFNISQTDGIEIKPKLELNVLDRYSKAQSILENYNDKPNIIEGANPLYNTKKDIIEIPAFYKFTTIDEYYSTLFHELVHSTGSSNRLNRFGEDDIMEYGNNNYTSEELVAEIGALFLSQEVGIIQKVKDNSISYIYGWLKYINNNKREIIYASSKAEKSVDYILGVKKNE